MKKTIICMIAVAAMVCVAASGQDQPKKKGGFLKGLAKATESVTGLDVSKETLFVYPEIGQWKMKLISATGDPETGVVNVRIGIMPLGGQKSAFLKLTQVTGEGNVTLPKEKNWKPTSKFMTRDLSESLLYHDDLASGTYSEYQFQPILVAGESKTIKSLRFDLEVLHDIIEGFEARDIPITWETPAEE